MLSSLSANRIFRRLSFVCAIAVVSTAMAATGGFPGFPEDPQTHHWEKVGEGVYAFISPPGITPLVSGNSLVVIGDDGLLVVDSGQFPSLARAEIAEIKKLSPLPVRYIVNTHWHLDHWVGNGEFRKAWPGVAIVSTQNTLALAQAGASEFTSAYAVAMLDSLNKAIALGGKRGDGSSRPAQEIAYLDMAKAQLTKYRTELETVNLAFPDVVFASELDLYLGKRLVQVRFLGRANTGGDAVVYVPDAKVLATGDMLVSPSPYGGGSFYGEWPATLRRLAAFDTIAIVPGHGEVQHDKAYLVRMIKLLDGVNARVAASIAAGESLEQAQKKITLDDEVVEFCGGLAFEDWCERSFRRSFIANAVTRSYREQKEGPLTSEKD
jgi:glyoxylase-like metal-dependent hydrolase (beta-lactamase superfamily II)